MRCIGNILQEDVASLSATLALEAKTARIEVQCLLQDVLHVSRAYLLAHPEQILSEIQKYNYEIFLQRRMQGEPIAYLLGQREFFGLNFKVTPATLIPRPETELLVELALQRIAETKVDRILDLGTGSGAIALSIAHARSAIEIVAVDASEAALVVARANAERLKIHNVAFLLSNWFSALNKQQQYDVIVANPPYIRSDDIHLAEGDVRFEPLSALASGTDGLNDIRHIINNAHQYLAPGGLLLLEHGYDQATRVRGLLQQSGFAEIFSQRDIAGIERCSGGLAI